MDERLRRLLEERLFGDENLADDAAVLVLAACDGAPTLADVLGGAARPAGGASAVTQPVDPPAAYLNSIAVEGFRGIGPRAELALEPGPGLTLVVGRNGSGKSSFAEGLEICLTGENRRWQSRTSIWTDGWRNVHHADPCHVAAAFSIDGVPGQVTAGRSWEPGAALGESAATLTGHPDAASLHELGWPDALHSWRPFLSYNELGGMFQGRPSEVYDALASILGLNDLVAVAELLKNERTTREKALKASAQQVPALIELLAGLDDERAVACRAALDATPWDLEAVELALGGTVDDGDPEGDLAALRALTHIARPAPEATAQALRDAAGHAEQQAQTDAGAAQRVADLLERALAHHHAAGDGDCPVCGTGALDAAWRATAEPEMAALRERATSARAAATEVARTLAAAARAMDPAPAALDTAERLGIDATAAREAWGRWHAGHALTDARDMATHIDTAGPALDAALAQVRETATAELERREDAWRPAARALREWLPGAARAVDDSRHVQALKAAEAWVKDVTGDVRSERFAPLADAAVAHWSKLRQGSSVDVTSIGLAGAATQRRVQIDVEIDGADSAALGVMSQGELCSLALCMFLPRATLDESPFRFVVIDDPVQSMDPAKVDGLARVLESVASTRQVLVFTHDDRLPESARRLGIAARVVEVIRREGSRVDLVAGRDPMEAHLDDARAALRTNDMPEAAARRVVPGLCRQAIEAACQTAVRRRRLARGERHADLEAALAEVSGLTAWVALALFDSDDNEQRGKVLSRLNNGMGRRAAGAFQGCNKGAHGNFTGPLPDLVAESAKLARALAGQP